MEATVVKWYISALTRVSELLPVHPLVPHPSLMFDESTLFVYNIFSSLVPLGHLQIIVSVVTNPYNKLQSSNNQNPCLISPSVVV